MPADSTSLTAARSLRQAACLIAGIACSSCQAPPDVRDWTLADGTPLLDVVSGHDTAVVLVADPSDCFACSAAVGEWATRRAAGQILLYLVLTREPTPDERKQLAIFRLPIAGILSGSRSSRGVPSMEYVVVRGEVVMADTLREGRRSSTVVQWARDRNRDSL